MMKPSQISMIRRGRSAIRSAAGDSAPFEFLCDSEGTVRFGWAAISVFYACFEGGLSAYIGDSYATRLAALIAPAQSLAFFCDISHLEHYDLLARSAFVRAVLSHRRKFESITILTWAEGVSAAMQTIVETLGDPVEVLNDRQAFEARLSKVAPRVRCGHDVDVHRHG